MKRSRSTDSEALQAGRLAEMALRASLGALGPDDLIVIGPRDPQTGAPDPGAERLEAVSYTHLTLPTSDLV